jgi:hypothetical protein
MTPKKSAIRVSAAEISALLRALNAAERADALTPAMASVRKKFRDLRERVYQAGHGTGSVVGG